MLTLIFSLIIQGPNLREIGVFRDLISTGSRGRGRLGGVGGSRGGGQPKNDFTMLLIGLTPNFSFLSQTYVRIVKSPHAWGHMCPPGGGSALPHVVPMRWLTLSIIRKTHTNLQSRSIHKLRLSFYYSNSVYPPSPQRGA